MAKVLGQLPPPLDWDQHGVLRRHLSRAYYFMKLLPTDIWNQYYPWWRVRHWDMTRAAGDGKFNEEGIPLRVAQCPENCVAERELILGRTRKAR